MDVPKNKISLTVRGMRSLIGNGPMHFAGAWSFLDGVKAGAIVAADGRD
ncbi:hypothetical protein [Streptomyces sp. NBC_01314]|nr:hypothetical protein OG622_49430 [Streptomyces sp. NBC_01314]